jgi:DNA primase
MAGQIPRDFIDSLLARTDIVELINNYTPLKKKGSNYMACCPFHGEKTPSFSVSSSKQFYHCFGCGVSGDAIAFLREYDHLEFSDAVEELADRAGIAVPKIAYHDQNSSFQHALHKKTPLFDLLDIASKFYKQHLHSQLSSNSPSAIADYIGLRGLSEEIIKDYEIGYSPPHWDIILGNLKKHENNLDTLLDTGLVIHNEEKNKYYDRFRNRLMFPIRDKRGRTIGFGGRRIDNDENQAKYINSPETPLFHKGNELYGLYELTRALRHIDQILVVEGYMDVVSLAQQGIRYAVATLGTATTTAHLEKLFRACNNVIFCFDGDRAGKEAASKAMFNLLPLIKPGYQARFMFIEEGEDPDSLVRKVGKEQFEEKILKADLLSDFFFDFLLQRVEINKSEGRSQLIDLARPYLDSIPSDSAFYLLMKDRLAKVAGVSSVDLGALLSVTQTSNKPATEITSKSSMIKEQVNSPAWRAISYLLAYPELALLAGNPDNYQDIYIDGMNIFIRLLDLLQLNPHFSPARIISMWDNRSEESMLEQAMFTPLLIEEKQAISNEYLEILQLFSLQKQQARFEQLQLIHNSKGLSEQEKKEYLQLIQLQHDKNRL